MECLVAAVLINRDREFGMGVIGTCVCLHMIFVGSPM